MTKAISESSRPIYTGEDFCADIETAQALRYSAEADGRSILLPLKWNSEKVKTLASPSFWSRRIFGRRLM
jgi:hypothetical protein